MAATRTLESRFERMSVLDENESTYSKVKVRLRARELRRRTRRKGNETASAHQRITALRTIVSSLCL